MEKGLCTDDPHYAVWGQPLRRMSYRDAPTEKLILGSRSLWNGFSVDMQMSIGCSSQLWIWEEAQLSSANLECWWRKYMCQQAASTISLERIKNKKVDGIKKIPVFLQITNHQEGYPRKNIYLIKHWLLQHEPVQSFMQKGHMSENRFFSWGWATILTFTVHVGYPSCTSPDMYQNRLQVSNHQGIFSIILCDMTSQRCRLVHKV